MENAWHIVDIYLLSVNFCKFRVSASSRFHLLDVYSAPGPLLEHFLPWITTHIQRSSTRAIIMIIVLLYLKDEELSHRQAK